MLQNVNNEEKPYAELEGLMFVKKKTVPDLQQLIPTLPDPNAHASPPRVRCMFTSLFGYLLC